MMRTTWLAVGLALGILTPGCGDVSETNPEPVADGGVQDGSASQSFVAFVAVHLEVGTATGQAKVLPRETTHPQRTWPTLLKLVSAADRDGVRLTLQFNPQWATYVLEDAARLAQVRAWEKKGHEIALHHHGPTHGDWNGYTNRVDKKSDPGYIGDVDQMMALVGKLPAAGKILSGGITDEATDWPSEVIYDTSGGVNESDLLSTPRRVVFNGTPVNQITYRMYATANQQAADLDEIEAGYLAGTANTIMGLVFHAADYSVRGDKIDRLFRSLAENKIATATVQRILEGRPVASADAGVKPFCGDGVCGAVEKSGGFCPQDCK
jgi:hypothetical protein